MNLYTVTIRQSTVIMTTLVAANTTAAAFVRARTLNPGWTITNISL